MGEYETVVYRLCLFTLERTPIYCSTGFFLTFAYEDHSMDSLLSLLLNCFAVYYDYSIERLYCHLIPMEKELAVTYLKSIEQEGELQNQCNSLQIKEHSLSV